MSGWQRPSSVPYPQIYYEFEGKVSLPNGKKRQYWIQDLTEEYYEDVVRHYITEFINDEPISKYSGVVDDPIAVKEFAEMWKELLGLKISLICLTKDEDGAVKIAGFNCLCVQRKDEVHESKSPKTQKVLGLLKYMGSKRDPYEEFKCDYYLSAMGLFVLREFRGEGLGQVILCKRDEIGKRMGFKVGLTVFTSPISQKQAERAGFKDYVTVNYADLPAELLMPGIEKQSKICKIMYKEYV